MEPLVLGLLVLLGLLAAIFLLTSFSLWAAARLLSLPDKGFRRAMKAAALYMAFLATLLILFFGSTLFFVGLRSLVEPFSILVLVLSVASIVYIIKRVYGVDWRDAVLAFLIYFVVSAVLGGVLYYILAASVVTWQLSVFSAAGSSYVSGSGWTNLAPVSAAAVYGSDGGFESVFESKLSSQMNVSSVSVRELVSGAECGRARAGGGVVAPGRGLEVSAWCPARERGQPYEVEVRVDYVVVDRGVLTEYRETGRIRGAVE